MKLHIIYILLAVLVSSDMVLILVGTLQEGAYIHFIQIQGPLPSLFLSTCNQIFYQIKVEI